MSLLKPFRPVGSVCGEQPASLTHFNGIPFLVVPLGFTFAVYKGLELRAIRGGPTFEHPITALVASGKYRIVAEGANLHCLAHHKILWTAQHNPILKSGITHLAIRDNIVFSIGQDRTVSTWSLRRGHRIFTFLIDQKQQQQQQQQQQSEKNNRTGGKKSQQQEHSSTSSSAAVTSVTIPVEYSNKILIGLADGTIHLYNFSRPANLSSEEGASGVPFELAPLFVKKIDSSAISAMHTSAVKDIIAIGTSTGRVLVYDFASDDIISEFRHSANMDPTRINLMLLQHQQQSQSQSASAQSGLLGGGSFVTALAFRQETPNNHAMLVSAAADGSIAVWNLEKRNLHGMLSATKQRGTEQALQTPAHHSSVHTIAFLDLPKKSDFASTNSAHPPDSLLVSAGSDNAIIQWSFHTVDGAAIRIRLRSGHRGACTFATFYGPDLVVSSAGDEDGSLRVTHLFSDRASWELSQGSGSERAAAHLRKNRSELLLAPCREILAAPIRNHQWSSVVTRHESSAKIGAWAFDARKLSFLSEPIRTVSQTVTCMALSLCGSYSVVGFSSGHVVRVNLQDESLLHFVHIGDDKVVADSGQDTEVYMTGVRSNDNRAVPSAHTGSVGSAVVAFDNDVVITCGPAKYFKNNNNNNNHNNNNTNNNNSNKTAVVGNCWMFWSLREGKLLGWSRSVESPVHILREVGSLSSDKATKSAASTLLCAAGADHSLRVYNIPHPDASWYSVLPLEAAPVLASSSSNDKKDNKKNLHSTNNNNNNSNALSLQVNSNIRERVHVARHFRVHRSKITAVAVNPDTRRHIFSASADGGLAIWDVASASCIGLFNAYSPILSLNFDPDGAFLLTTHAGDRCPQLWSCLLRYGMVSRPIDIPSSSADFEQVWESNAVSLVGMLHKEDRDDDQNDQDDEPDNNSNNNNDKNNEKQRKGVDLFSEDNDIALQARRREQERLNLIRSIPTRGWSLAAQQQFKAAATVHQGSPAQITDTASVSMDDWLCMPRLDAIYQKNEPLLPPKKVEAPFFLPMTQELRPTFIVQQQEPNAAELEASRSAAQRRTKNAGATRRGLGIAVLTKFEDALRASVAPASTSSSSSSTWNNKPASSASLIQVVESLVTELVTAPGGVAALDAEILLLTSPVAEEDFEGQHDNVRNVLKLLRFCALAIRCGKAVDFVQALLATTLKHHGHLLAEICSSLDDDDDEDDNDDNDDGKNNKNRRDNDEDDAEKLFRESTHKVADEVRHVLALVKTAQVEAKSKIDSICGATTCFASTFANAYG